MAETSLIGWFREGVLNDDVLTVAVDGYHFKGGYEAVLVYHTYRNSMSNNYHVKRFKTLENARKFIDKNLLDGEWYV